MMLKICIWMNIPSHYQSAFFRALNARQDIDLLVIYLQGASRERSNEGWQDSHQYQPYECSVEGVELPGKLTEVIPDWRDRIHIVSVSFCANLTKHFSRYGALWCHWSEAPGIRLAGFLGYSTSLFRLLNPIMLLCKWQEGRQIHKYALGAYAQGIMARSSFRLMGISKKKIADLFYVPEALPTMTDCEQIVEFAAGRRIFLSVGALCCRKGIDILIKGFARLKSEDWCLVLCGLDRSGGEYQLLSRKLGIENQVLFLGAYASNKIAEVYAAADVFVLASRFDGWGAVLNEAASLGKPLIATDMCGGAWHVIEDGRNGFRVKEGSVSALVEKMRIYIQQPQLLEEHGRYSRELFFRKFTPERNAERLVTAISDWTTR